MKVKNIENLSGFGGVRFKNGGFLKDAEYLLQVLQEIPEARAEKDCRSFAGLRRIEGLVMGLDNLTLMEQRAVLTLHLSDGRHLDFQIADLGGRISASSGLYDIDRTL